MPSASEVRKWAKGHGLEVADTGRISADVLQAWQVAHRRAAIPNQRSTKSAQPPDARSPAIRKLAIPTPRPAPSDDSDQGPVPSKSAPQRQGFSRTEARLQALEELVIEVETRVSAMEETANRKPNPVFRRRT